MSGRASNRGHKVPSPKGSVVALIERDGQMRLWMVERDVAWLNRNGRLAEVDASVDPATAFSYDEKVIADASSSSFLLAVNSSFLTHERATPGLCFLPVEGVR